ncbi:hypothetical protein QLH51_06685 [Sphingomonas sp. 2R-10]|uniref:hypothetical protein n=1 Tax=Sphingomonas sp. 2R-10 TaxID=3045148 RepID=UPI000F77BE74|nr:hypothetical protein [Sphingomonas sp. 2R-10]MDJ0276478.1 hypothetical protein [Sphingomonas sp. 2R-10]
MDEKTRRFIREAELERIHAREGRTQLRAQRQIEADEKHAKRIAYVAKYGRDVAVSRTLMKWTGPFILLAILSFPDRWKNEGFGQALLGLVVLPLMGFLIGAYRASRLPYVE